MKTIIGLLLFLSCQSIFSRTINSPIPPVELTSFTGQVVNSVVHLSWTTDSEFNNLGFTIERAIQIGQWQEIGFVEGKGTTNEPQTYEYKDLLINIFAEKLYYRLKQIDFDGTFQYSAEIEITLQQITLRDTTNQYDYIIITVPEFVNACEPFRQHKETVRNFSTLIVDTTQIFAEFDSSAAPQDNIRGFISYAGTFWKEPRPKFFLIAGTVDNIPNFPIPFPSQPTIFYHSDYYFCQNIYENDSTTTDFYIGRIPGKNGTELTNYFSKVIEYESDNNLSDWMNNNLFICEDDIQFGFLEAAFSIEARFPGYIRSFFIVDDTSLIYYGDKDSIYKAINERGNAIVWFEGHNRDSFCINPDYFNLSDLTGLDNPGVPFVTIYTGTQQAIIDTNTNMTREMLVMESAGSMGGIVFVGIGYWGITQVFQNDWANRMFDPTFSSIGDIFNLDIHPSAGLYIYMKKITNIWADPSLQLKYDTTVGVEKVVDEIPQSFNLSQNYPNPFNPTTTIKFALPVDSRVKINVYNSLGQLVETLVDKEMESGYHEVNFDAPRLASGVYLYQLQAGEYVAIKKMILIK